MEPALSCVAALYSPETGIIDSHAFMLALEGALEDRSGMIAFNTPVEGLRPSGEGWEIRFGGADAGLMTVDAVVNSAGLGAQKLARATEGYAATRVPRLVLAKGSYFGFAGSKPSRCNRLRASLRARRTASAFSRAFFSDGFS